MSAIAETLSLSESQRRLLRRLRRPAWLGTLRRVTPLSDVYGFDRGKPIDRHYIEHFLRLHSAAIKGRVLEVRDSGYTQRFGTAVTTADVLDIDPANPRATIVDDLSTAASIPSDSFDCFVLTQTLQFIENSEAALAQARRILRPGGVLLCTVPAVSPIGKGTDYWRFTPALMQSFFSRAFGPANVTIEAYGNVLASIGFLTGISSEELRPDELDPHDPRFPLILAARAVKA